MISVTTSPTAARSERHNDATSGDAATKKQRKDAEKVRRDRFGSEVRHIANLLPPRLTAPSGASNKKPTKAATLRCAASYLRLHLFFPNQANSGRRRQKRNWIPSSLEEEIFNEFLDSLSGFILFTNMNGRILLVSAAVTSCLGYQAIDMMGNSIFEFIHESDQARVAGEFQKVMQSLDLFKVNDDEMVSSRFSFFCRFKEKTQSKADNVVYQVVRVSGVISGPSPADGVFERSHLNLEEFKIVAHAQKYNFSPFKKLSLLESRENEYITKHRLDGMIVFADQRISNLLGYLPSEVINRSAHMYMNPDDVEFAQKTLHDLLVNGSGYVVYRLKTKSSSLIYMRSAGGVLYDKTTSKPEYFVCVNTLMGEEEGKKEQLEFVKHYPQTSGTAQNTKNKACEALSVQIFDSQSGSSEEMGPRDAGFDEQTSGFSEWYNDFTCGAEGPSECSNVVGQTNYDLSPSTRASGSPDFVNPVISPHSPYVSSEIDSSGLLQSNLQATDPYAVGDRAPHYQQRFQWGYSQTEGSVLMPFGHQISMRSANEGCYGSQMAATSPVSLPSDSEDVLNQFSRNNNDHHH